MGRRPKILASVLGLLSLLYIFNQIRESHFEISSEINQGEVFRLALYVTTGENFSHENGFGPVPLTERDNRLDFEVFASPHVRGIKAGRMTGCKNDGEISFRERTIFSVRDGFFIGGTSQTCEMSSLLKQGR